MIVSFPLNEVTSNLTFASNSRLKTAVVSDTRFNLSLLSKLAEAGFIFSFRRSEPRKLKIYLKYVNSKPTFKQLTIVSKPTKRVYMGHLELRRNYQGAYLILSTKEGLLSREEALSRQIGGLLLLQIW